MIRIRNHFKEETTRMRQNLTKQKRDIFLHTGATAGRMRPLETHSINFT
jgi:hypothetical protein